MNEKEVTLTEAELSDVKNSIAKLCKKYIAGSFFDKLVDSSGIKIAKDILMSDLKEMIGHGTSAPAAKKFANAVLTAKSTPAVDTILANYMLKGDGMGAGIGYTESVESTIKPFQEFLSEARKAEKIETKPRDEIIAEAIKTVEAEGYKVNKIAEKSASHEVITQDQIDEAIEVAKKHGYRVISQEQIDEAKKIVESKGFRVVEDKRLNESETVVDAKLVIPTYDYDPEEIVDLIKATLSDRSVPTYLRNKFGEVFFNDKNVLVELRDAETSGDDLSDAIFSYIENKPGLEAEYDEDLFNNYPFLLKKAKIRNV